VKKNSFQNTDPDLTEIREASDLVENIYNTYLFPSGVSFKIRLFINNRMFNAHPVREGKNWFADIYGGLFKNPKVRYVNKDYLFVIACHEVGHHLGHTVYYPNSFWWASGEGQSDYYTTSKCLRRVFQETDNQKWLDEMEQWKDDFVQKELLLAKNKCNEAWDNSHENAICVRSALASSMTIANLTGSTKAYSLESSSKVIASKTGFGYPDDQCRLDTFLNGARCSLSFDKETSADNHLIGNCDSDDHLGKRPSCWYKPF